MGLGDYQVGLGEVARTIRWGWGTMARTIRWGWGTMARTIRWGWGIKDFGGSNLDMG